jgi:hypothetical protein
MPDSELQATTRSSILGRIRDALLSRAQAGGNPLRLSGAPADFNQPQPPLLGVGSPLKLRMAPGLYTSGQNDGLDLPMAPQHLRR